MKMMNMERALVEQQQREEQQRQIIETLRTQNLVIQQSLIEKQQQSKEIYEKIGVWERSYFWTDFKILTVLGISVPHPPTPQS